MNEELDSICQYTVDSHGNISQSGVAESKGKRKVHLIPSSYCHLRSGLGGLDLYLIFCGLRLKKL
jgi:hypothetical protein